MNKDYPKVSTNQAEEILELEFNMEGAVNMLPGYEDDNFRIKTNGGESFVLKISPPDVNFDMLNYQLEILNHLKTKGLDMKLPKAISNSSDYFLSELTLSGQKRYARLLSWVPGRVWAEVNPKTNKLRENLGEKAGALTRAFEDFNHPHAQREFDWNLANSDWSFEHLDRFEGERKEIVKYFHVRFKEIQKVYAGLPKSVIHNDLNDYNILVSEDLQNIEVSGFIDFGDAVKTQTVNELAILLAYTIMDEPDPLSAAIDIIKGYKKEYSFSSEELFCLYTLIGMRLITSVTKAAINIVNDPSNKYYVISEKPAWALLEKWVKVNEEFAFYSFRSCCGYSGHPNENDFQDWAKKQKINFSDLFPSVGKEEIHLLDLKVSSTWIGNKTEFNDLDLFQFKIDQLQKEHPLKLIAGGYCEPRPLYTSTEYDKEGNRGPESRTVHLGIDFWLPTGTPVHALYDGEIFTAVNDAGFKEYGGLIILKHHENDMDFYTLHGHLAVEGISKWKIGDPVKKGDCIGYLGDHTENGAWAPHLHFQIMLSMLDYEIDFPGVAYRNQLNVWKSICQDPNLLFKNQDLVTKYSKEEAEILSFRRSHLGKSMSLSYNEPLHIVRGEGVYLIDVFGKKYLDTANNVAHVGHEHPKVVEAGQSQMAVLNTNSRYLHEAINDYAEALLKKLPEELSVLHFVNSGSEANELALRMCMTYTGQTDFLAIEVGYHGNTNAVMDVSSYKFDGKGGKGNPANTHILPLPDPFRGRHKGAESGPKYASYAEKTIRHLKIVDENIAGFIGEPIISCGGQIMPPPNYFKEVYGYVRAAGGLCIADEVQTGFGRVGKTFWAFQLHDVIPDIVTMGKPVGNGHPLAVVACTREVADSFANGVEYFNTFGGNPVSCAIGKSVLDVVDAEKLQQNALEVGDFLKAELKKLQDEFKIIGDVRGEGLFLGFELVDAEINPLPEQTAYLANRMKDYGILMSVDGPDHNVIKIKPPLVFSKENAVFLIKYLKKVFSEDFMTTYS